MGIFKRDAPNKQATIVAQEEAPKFEHVNWRKEPGLRKLYWHAFVLCIASATTGYDGMFFNSVQNFETWKEVSLCSWYRRLRAPANQEIYSISATHKALCLVCSERSTRSAVSLLLLSSHGSPIISAERCQLSSAV
jgi:hypothetical protein